EYYEKIPGAIQRQIVPCEVNGERYVAFEFTRAQLDAMVALGKALAHHLPNIKLDYPQSSPGIQSWKTLDPTDPTGAKLRRSYSGYIGHFHITTQKWDPGPFDFKAHLGKVAGRRSFPVGLHALADRADLPDPG